MGSLMIRRNFFSRWLSLLIVLSIFSLSVGSAKEKDAKGHEARLKQLQQRVQYLASDELEGRAAGTEGATKAAHFLAEQLAALGYQKPWDTGYLQEFSVVTGAKLGPNNQLSVKVVVPRPGVPYEKSLMRTLRWKVDKDWRPLGLSSDSLVTDRPIVFCGYGISSKALKFDEYQDVDVKGKVALILRGTPDTTGNPHSRFARFASLRYKAINAREHGAAAVVFVSHEGDSADVLLKLEVQGLGKAVGIPVIHLKRSLAAKLFPPEKTLFMAEQEINRTQQPHSFALPRVRMTLQTDVDFVKSPTYNVVGILPGSDPQLQQQYLVVGAHYDHLGWGKYGSLYRGREPKIHYGADDNASGVVTVLEIARRLKENPPKRSVIVAFFGAEEMGLLGSKYLVEHFPVPLDHVVMMLNLDMVGRLKNNRLTIMGAGTSSAWTGLIDSIKHRFGLEISTTADGFGPSDHASFYAKQIPVLFLFTGLHSDYHRPSDTWKKLNYEGMLRVADVAVFILQTVGNAPERPAFVKVKQTQQRRRGGPLKIYLGTIPDYADHPKGMRISGVREGSPAEQGGLQEGDVIIRIGDVRIHDIYDFMYALSQYNPGDTLRITVLRGDLEDQQVTLKVVAGDR